MTLLSFPPAFPITTPPCLMVLLYVCTPSFLFLFSIFLSLFTPLSTCCAHAPPHLVVTKYYPPPRSFPHLSCILLYIMYHNYLRLRPGAFIVLPFSRTSFRNPTKLSMRARSIDIQLQTEPTERSGAIPVELRLFASNQLAISEKPFFSLSPLILTFPATFYFFSSFFMLSTRLLRVHSSFAVGNQSCLAGGKVR